MDFNRKKILQGLISILFSYGLASCTVTPPAQTSNLNDQIDHILQRGIQTNQRLERQSVRFKEPTFLDNALTPKLSVAFPQAKQEKADARFNISVDQVSARTFFIGLVKNTKDNIVVSPDIKGTISLDLKNVTVEDVLNAVRDNYGYEYEKMSYGYRILPRHLQTHIYSINYLDVDRVGDSTTTISSGQITKSIQANGTNHDTQRLRSTEETKPSSSIETKSHMDFWTSLKQTLLSIVGDKAGRQVVINPQTGLIIVKAYPNELRQVTQYLDSVQHIMMRQVIIEAKILEIELNASYQTGIQWNILGLKQEGNQDFSDPLHPFKNSLKPFTNIFTLNITDGGTFAAVIRLLNSQGKVNVLSSPRIATMNNQKAVIKVGEDRFFITGVENTITNNDSISNTQDVDLTPFFSGIALDVTPQISRNGEVILHIHPLVSKVTEERKKYKIGQANADDVIPEQELPLAQSSVRESDSVVRAKNGQVVVIGGLMENSSSDFGAATPGADKVPGISGLFKDVNRGAKKFELVILLRPVIVDNQAWNQELNLTREHVKNMKAEFNYTVDWQRKAKQPLHRVYK